MGAEKNNEVSKLHDDTGNLKSCRYNDNLVWILFW